MKTQERKRKETAGREGRPPCAALGRKAVSLACSLALAFSLLPAQSAAALAEALPQQAEASIGEGRALPASETVDAQQGAAAQPAAGDASPDAAEGPLQALEEHEHAWGEGAVTAEPTCGKAGAMTYPCTVEGCAETRTEEISATGLHDFGAEDACAGCGVYFLATSENADGTLTVTGSLKTLAGALEIPATIDGKRVTALADGAFRRAAITSLTVPEGVTSIGEEAFYACLKLSKITLPDSLKTVGDSAFYSLRALCDVRLPSGVTDWGIEAFHSCTALTSVSFAEGATVVGEEMFSGCARLTDLALPDSITTIKKGAFRDCARITGFGRGDDEFGHDAPAGLREVGDEAFYGCSSLVRLVFHDKLEKVGDRAFFRIANNETDEYAGADITLHGPAFLTFEGDAPAFADEAFGNLVAVIAYPEKAEGWDEARVSGAEGRSGYFGSFDVQWEGIAHVHAWDGGTVAKEATCTEEGAITYRCTAAGCDAAREEAVAALGHKIEGGACVRCGINYLLYDEKGADGTIRVTGVVSGYDGFVEIPSSIDGKAVTAIKTGAFKGTSITGASIPASVTTIGTSAFQNCKKLTSVALEDGLARIGQSMFSGCSALPSIRIPASVSSVGPSAFLNCTGLTEVVFAPGATAIGKTMFQGCTSLASVELSASINSIGDLAFANCTALSSVVLDEGLTTLGTSMFSGCTGLAALELPTSLTDIGAGAFQNCTSLADLAIPEGATVLGESMFQGCTSLTSLALPSSLTTVGAYAFASCNRIEEVQLAEGLALVGDHMFDTCTSLMEVDIPGSAASIGAYAFRGCSSLSDAYLHDGLRSIGDHAFYDCSSISAYDFPATLEEIGAYAFAVSGTVVKNTGLTLDYPSGVKRVGDCAFLNRWDIARASVPAGVDFGENVYRGCYNLASLDIEEGVASIPAGTARDTRLSSLSLPSTVGEIGPYAFYGTKIASLSIPEGAVSVGDHAFDGCTSLRSLSLGSTVKNLGDYAFYRCGALYKLDLGSVETIGAYCFGECTSERLTAFAMPDTVTSIGEAFLYNDQNITHLTLSGNLRAIPELAFSELTLLSSLTIPASVESINATAFTNCYMLTEVRFLGAKPASSGPGSYDDRVTYFYYPETPGLYETYEGIYGLENWRSYDHLHQWELAGTTEEPTCTKMGKGTYACAVEGCAETKTDDILALGHDFDEGGHCLRCGAMLFVYHKLASGKLAIDGVLSDYEGPVAIPSKIGSLEVSAISDGALNGNAGVTSLTIPSTIKSIGQLAFANCAALESVYIEDGIASLPDRAFQGCAALASVRLPATLKKMGGLCFAGCTSLESVEIPASLKSCQTLTETYNNGATVEVVDSGAFAGCTSLASVTLPEGLTCLGYQMFRGCTALKSVTLPSTLTDVEDQAFRDCTGLESISYGEGITALGTQMFRGCTGLEKVALPATVTNWNEGGTFNGCTGITAAVIPKELEELPAGVFGGCSNLSSLEFPQGSGLTTLGPSSLSGTGFTDLVLPNTVKTIGSHALYNCPRLQSVTLPGSVETIEAYAFCLNESLRTFIMPDSVTSVGEGALYHCGKLRLVRLSAALTAIPEGLCWRCSSLQTVVIPEGSQLKTIGYRAFKECAHLTAISPFPSTLAAIGDEAFYGAALRAVALPEGLRTLGARCFYRNDFASVRIPGTLITMGDGAFEQCASLKDVTFGEGLAVLGASAFAGTALERVVLPSTLKSIGDGLFNGCSSLKEAVLPEGLEVIGAKMLSGTAISHIDLPSTVKSFGSYAFANCTLLREVKVPYGIEGIPDYCFSGCTSLATISLPDSVTSVGRGAFSGCLRMASATLPNSITSIGAGAFSQCEKLEALTVPAKLRSFPAIFGVRLYALRDLTFTGKCPDFSDWAFSGLDGVTVHYPQISDAWERLATSEAQLGGSNITWQGYGHEHCFDYETIQEQGCETQGVVRWTCSLCDYNELHYLDPLGHDYARDGFCKRCGASVFTYEETADGTLCITGFRGIHGHGFCSYEGTTDEELQMAAALFATLTVPASIDGKAVTAIGDHAFAGRPAPGPSGGYEWCGEDWMGRVLLPATLASIGEGAFEGCDGISSVTLPAGVRELGSRAFARSSLGAISLSAALTAIPDECFAECGRLYRVDLHGDLTSIGAGAFSSCTSLQRFDVPESVEYLYEGTFAFCTSLARVTLHEGLQGIGAGCFAHCTSLATVAVPDSVVALGDTVSAVDAPGPGGIYGVFEGSGISSVRLGANITNIPASCFARCERLASVAIPDRVVTVGKGAFSGCPSLRSVSMGDSVQSLGASCFEFCSSLAEVTLSQSLRAIPASCFYGCYSLTSVRIPDSVATIGKNAFYCTSLSSVNMPANLASIGADAFRGTLISSVTFPATLASIGTRAFALCTNLKTIYFTGDAPRMAEEFPGAVHWIYDGDGDPYKDTGSFGSVIATVYYPGDNTTYRQLMEYSFSELGIATATFRVNQYQGDGELTWVSSQAEPEVPPVDPGDEEPVAKLSTASHYFVSASFGYALPQAVRALTPADISGLEDGAEVSPTMPSETSVTVVGGTWVFAGYDFESQVVAGDDVLFVGSWVFVPGEPGGGGSGGGDDPEPGGGGDPEPGGDPQPGGDPEPGGGGDPVGPGGDPEPGGGSDPEPGADPVPAEPQPAGPEEGGAQRDDPPEETKAVELSADAASPVTPEEIAAMTKNYTIRQVSEAAQEDASRAQADAEVYVLQVLLALLALALAGMGAKYARWKRDLHFR